MAVVANATAFVTKPPDSFGTEPIKILMARGHEVFALTWSLDAAQRVPHDPVYVTFIQLSDTSISCRRQVVHASMIDPHTVNRGIGGTGPHRKGSHS